ncbi:MAG: glcD: glycolate oxidase, subunit GlcD [Firmicutes bacterium]|nr:glcD: glycolate oxidase, subunit GlcD [Bacillota bacterium]
MLSQDLLEKLEASLKNGQHHVQGGIPAVSVSSVEEISRLFTWAAARDRSLYAYQQAKPGGIQLQFDQLNQIEEIDSANLVATVQAGVKLGELTDRLAEQGLRFVPAVPLYYRNLTIGQLFQQGYSNLMSLKYGPAKHFLMGTNLVLPTGEVLKTGGKTVKNVTGYDNTRFLNGPQTSFGITASYLLKLLPVPDKRHTLILEFVDFAAVHHFVETLKQRSILPAYLLWVELRVCSLVNSDKLAGNDLVILELDGVESEVAEQKAKILKIVHELSAVIHEDMEGVGERTASFACLFDEEQPSLLLEEIRVPYGSIDTFVKKFHVWKREKGCEAALFGQLREGRIHVCAAGGKTESIVKDCIEMAVQAGGVSTGRYKRSCGLNDKGIFGQIETRMRRLFDSQQILNR